jgi:hypothetical protein
VLQSTPEVGGCRSFVVDGLPTHHFGRALMQLQSPRHLSALRTTIRATRKDVHRYKSSGPAFVTIHYFPYCRSLSCDQTRRQLHQTMRSGLFTLTSDNSQAGSLVCGTNPAHSAQRRRCARLAPRPLATSTPDARPPGDRGAVLILPGFISPWREYNGLTENLQRRGFAAGKWQRLRSFVLHGRRCTTHQSGHPSDPADLTRTPAHPHFT